MGCEQFLELMEAEALAIEEIDAEISQLQNAKNARMATMWGYWMQYSMCLNGMLGRLASGVMEAIIAIPKVSDLAGRARKRLGDKSTEVK